MSMQTDSEDTFINYICKELSSRQLDRSDYYKVELENGCNKS